MRQGELFSSVCETQNNASGLDVDLTVNTSLEKTGQTPIDELECIKCHIVQHISRFSVMPSGEVKRTCRSCRNGHQNLLRKLKKENPYPDENHACPICTRTLKEMSARGQKRMQSWVLDHCHNTNTFRGWICHHCNTGLGGFKDNSGNVSRAYEYLIKHRMKPHGL